MKDIQIDCRCAEPVIIVNNKIRYYINSINCIYLNGRREYTKYTFDTIKKKLSRIKYKDKVNYETYQSYYIVTYDGEIIPVYILVPCNKCFICKDKLSQMWQFRGIAETNSSKSRAYFITLTYNNTYLPFYGVSPVAIQLFMKRLRNNLDKKGITHGLKYFACGEYGCNTQRPHYHLILWHFPEQSFKTLSEILEFIVHSWSVYNFETQEHTQIGYCYVKPCDTGSLRYVMKYTRKIGTPPKGKNPFFTCCSKHIGIQWFFDNYDYLKKHPALLSLSIRDNIKNDVFTSPLPTYYKQKLMPDFCKIFPKEIISAFDYSIKLHTEISTIYHIINYKDYKPADILNKYMHIIYDSEYNNLSSNDIDDYTYYRYSNKCPFLLNEIVNKKLDELLPYLILLDNYYQLHINEYNISTKLKDKRKIYLDKREFPQNTLNSLRIENDKLQRYRKKEIQREYF